jgi:hypothetical protein
MNYINHLNKVFQLTYADVRLTPYHLSLYYTLIQFWNRAHFRNPISISRYELMQVSKIGSVNTYIKCIKELEQFGFIQYKPSYNAQIGSSVYLFTFDNANEMVKESNTIIKSDNAIDKQMNKQTDTIITYDNANKQVNKNKALNSNVNNTIIKSDNAIDKLLNKKTDTIITSDNANKQVNEINPFSDLEKNTIIKSDNSTIITSDNADDKPMSPYINILNNTKHINNTIESEREKKIALAQKKIIENNLSEKKLQVSEPNLEERKKIAPKKESENAVKTSKIEVPVPPLESSLMQHPQAIEVKNYFIQNAWPILEAEKFFSHYQSNGWLVGGKSPMINWKASAQKWMLNSKDFAHNQKVTSSGVEKREQNNLHVNQNKNYAEPL